MKGEKVIILFSGGYDSTLLVELARYLEMQVHCVIVDYGQVHKEELQCATDFCVLKEVPYTFIKVPLPVKSKLTDGVEEQYDNVSEWHVPSRNLIFVSVAASIAESKGFELIWYGANYDDREQLFPDCYQEWVYNVNAVMRINGSKPVRVRAPLLGMTKPLIEALAIKFFGIDPDKIFSGYGNR